MQIIKKGAGVLLEFRQILSAHIAAFLVLMGILVFTAEKLHAAEDTKLLAYEDVSGTASPDWVIANSDEIFSPRDDPFVGQSGSAWWLRIQLATPLDTPSTRYLVFPYQRHTSVALFQKSPLGTLVHTENGSSVSVSERDVKTGVIAFSIELQPDREADLYVRITNSDALWLTYQVADYNGLIQQESMLLFKLLSSVSLIVTLILLNLELAIRVRRNLFLPYAGYLVFGLVFAAERFSGWEYVGVIFPISTIGIGACMFLMMAFVIYRLFPLSNEVMFFRPLAVVVIAVLAVGIISLFDPVLGASIYRGGFGSLATLLITLAICYAVHRKMPHARLALLGWSLFVLGALSSMLLFRGVLTIEYTGIAVAGLLGEAFIFTLILSSNERYKLQQAGFEERQRSAMERTSQLALIGEQSAVLSHELKQPLNAIRLAVGNMTRSLNRGGESVQDKWPEKLARIDTMVDRAVELTEFVRRSSRQTDDDRPLASFNESMISSRLMLGGDLSASNIELLVEVAEDLPLLMIHPLRLDQLLVNIIGNARDAIRSTDPEKRWIKVSAASSPSDQVLVTIEDSAGGIPEHLLAEIFTKFFTTKDASIGTGLGLSVCRDILDDVGGSISVSNTENGAYFELMIPIEVKACV